MLKPSFVIAIMSGCTASPAGTNSPMSCSAYPTDCSLSPQSDFASVISTPLMPVKPIAPMGIQVYSCRADPVSPLDSGADVKIHCYDGVDTAFHDAEAGFQTDPGYSHLDGLGMDAFWLATLTTPGQATGTIEVLVDSSTIMFVDAKAFPDVAGAEAAAKQLATSVLGRL